MSMKSVGIRHRILSLGLVELFYQVVSCPRGLPQPTVFGAEGRREIQQPLETLVHPLDGCMGNTVRGYQRHAIAWSSTSFPEQSSS